MRITQVKEKVKISDHANSGCYCFASGRELATQCQALLDAGSTQLSQDAVGEYYTSGVIAVMIDEGHTFVALQIDPARFHGTPLVFEPTTSGFWPEESYALPPRGTMLWC